MNNILLIAPTSLDIYAGGVQRSTCKLVGLFADLGNKVYVYVESESALYDENLIQLKIFKRTNTFILIRHIVKVLSIDLVINQYGYSCKINLFLLGKDLKIVNTLRINPDFYKRVSFERRLYPILDYRFFRVILEFYYYIRHAILYNIVHLLSDRTILLMESQILEFQKYIKQRDIGKIKAIPNFFPGLNNDEKTSYNLKENIILFVGRVEYNQKRVDLLLKIWILLHSLLRDYRFVLIGEGSYLNIFEESVKSLNLDRVDIIGKANPENWYRRAKILHFTSSYEGLGNVLIEAQIHGVVPIAFRSYAGVDDLILDNKTGILIESFDIDKFVHSTKELALDNRRIEKYSDNARLHSQKFSEAVIKDKWKKVFSELGVS